jgi:hypothetical protein
MGWHSLLPTCGSCARRAGWIKNCVVYLHHQYIYTHIPIYTYTSIYITDCCLPASLVRGGPKQGGGLRTWAASPRDSTSASHEPTRLPHHKTRTQADREGRVILRRETKDSFSIYAYMTLSVHKTSFCVSDLVVCRVASARPPSPPRPLASAPVCPRTRARDDECPSPQGGERRRV